MAPLSSTLTQVAYVAHNVCYVIAVNFKLNKITFIYTAKTMPNYILMDIKKVRVCVPIDSGGQKNGPPYYG